MPTEAVPDTVVAWTGSTGARSGADIPPLYERPHVGAAPRGT
ncbi:hypothetical protein [Streptomyces spinosus]|nr:hypothetical protein [Streptomyces spinosus]